VLLAPAGEPLPCDDRAFVDFIARFRDQELESALRNARPKSPIYRYGPTFNRMMHYDCLTAWPTGLVALGDSVCTLDPYSGLGMTAAARGVLLLKNYLKTRGELSTLEFQKELARLNAQPWQLATGCDSNGQLVACDRTDLSRLYEAAQLRPEVARAFLAVQHMLRPAESLMELGI
jgi:hypothetical protein